VVLQTRGGLEEAASAQIARFASQVLKLRDDLRGEAEDQTLAFEDLAALRLVELEERLGQAADSKRPASGEATDPPSPAARDTASDSAADVETAPVTGLRPATSS
jgi:hypothetical protein